MDTSSKSQRQNTRLRQASGATAVEYAIAIALLGFVVIMVALSIVPSATGFHTQMSDGMDVPYPRNFLTPTPTP